MVLHGNRLEDLRDLLAAWLARTPLRPLEDELMLVQSNGIAQWLKLALARSPEKGGLGISAAINMQLPGRFLWTAYRAVLGRDAVAVTSPFDKSRLTWLLLRLLPLHLEDDGFEPLRDFLRSGSETPSKEPAWIKRYQLAMQIADLFDQYQVYRADWLDDWERGRDVLRDDLRVDATPVSADQRWQPKLWRLLLTDIGATERERHRAAVHRSFIARIGELAERPAALPRRIVVFGISSLPQQTLEALTAMARFSQVLLVIANPCRHYWADIIEDRELLRADNRRQQDKPGVPALPRYEDLHLHANPLLAAWGKQGRDYIRLLDSFDQPERYRSHFAEIGRSIDIFQDVEGDGLLQQVQQDILDLRPLPAEPAQRRPWQSGDNSLRFHVTHNPQREVEVLHDQLLAMFEQAAGDGRPLAPRDVIVMVPDIQAYAPHVQAVFGRLPIGDPRHLPYSVADQSARATAPLIVALAHLLALPESRFAVSDVLDLLDVPALRHRFELDEDDLPTLRRWIEGAGIRWGLDGAQKRSLDLPALEQNTWRFGLRRMLLGYAAGDGETFDGIAPYGEVGGLDATLLGPLSALLDRLEAAWQWLGSHATPAAWAERLHGLLDDFFDNVDSEDAGRLNRLHDALDTWLEACDEAAFEQPIPLAVVREHWLQAIDESRLSQRFMGGAVSFGTLMPMRAIPFRVVCLLGMNDGDYPRRQTPLDFDLMAQSGRIRPGDRSRREDDRYLFLEALLSARDALHISWVGRSARDNSELPPSVLVGQLRDYLAAGWHRAQDAADAADAGERLLEALTCEYPLQPFSRRYFEGGQAAHLFTYAHEWQQAHRVVGTPVPAAGLDPWVPETALSLIQLQRFLARPVAYFFNQRLKVHFTDANGDTLDDEPFALDGLQRHAAMRDVLHAVLGDDRGSPLDAAVAKAVRRLGEEGRLPPGGFGVALQEEITRQVQSLADLWQSACLRWQPQDDKFELHHARGELSVEDWLIDLRRDKAGQLRRLELVSGNLLDKTGTLRFDKLTHAWVIHLLANANGLALQTQLIGVDTQPTFASMSREHATHQLDALLDALRQGMDSPLPIARRSAFAWLAAADGGKDPVKAAALSYDGSDYGQGVGEVRQDAYLARAWPRFEQLHQAGFERWLSLYRPLTMALLPVEAAI
ncbi:exodeoxyribonuclease V subunit gamma [Rhodanobacter sp. T12-5]|uniref:exodeoxyribonuclease V subunit gamma n=1 Tax=Rhodanobacter sp. T12-5 TaxID=2024611 RepID=UPI0011EFF8F2|nr:exodeoxyribonuclease V subunit gamma [Rhodanobacter sp. T12-5]KAA0070262.1 exodeoxyribonuclease V subunit gamma [Rhodanobacter sp. T12-5]